jgi:hypothetical protein
MVVYYLDILGLNLSGPVNPFACLPDEVCNILFLLLGANTSLK